MLYSNLEGSNAIYNNNLRLATMDKEAAGTPEHINLKVKSQVYSVGNLGRRGSFFQDQEDHHSQEADGGILSATKCKSFNNSS